MEKLKKSKWMLTAMVMALALSSMLAACGPEEVLVMEVHGNNRVRPVKFGHLMNGSPFSSARGGNK